MLNALDFNRLSIEHAGFQGFVTIDKLQASKYRDVPSERGIYLILRPVNVPPTFLPHSIGGRFKGKDPTEDVTTLEERWLDRPIVVYIGKAGSLTGSATIKSRLWCYMKFGLGEPVGHWGGRYIWQLAEARDLLACWKLTPDEDPRAIEKHLTQAFQAKYGRLPFANLRT
jgi:hypothetical protein